MAIARRPRKTNLSPPKDSEKDLQEFQLKFLQDQLDSEEKRKQSIEQRGITVITSAGAIATLIFAVSTFVSKITSTANFVREEALPIKLSIVSFLIAAVFGLVVNIPFRYGNISAKSLHEGFMEAVQGKGGPARYRLRLIAADSEILRRNQKLNLVKAEVLLAGFLFEIIGIGLLVWAVFEIVSHAL